MDIDEVDVIEEMYIDEDLNFWDESTNVSSFINGNFKTKMVAGSFYIPNSNKAPLGQLVRNIDLSIHKQKGQRNKTQLMKVLNEAYFKAKYLGSLTAYILTLTCDIVHAVNIVDRRVVIRDGLGNGVKFDDPSVAHEIKVTVRIGFMIVMSTDGLFDNAHDIEFEKLACNGQADLHELGTFRRY
ncbi:hypothetical protein KY289_020211 [Solanum tuberosum]|nr:hypothetical protein KY289_020211 [Solanum tuberosum]